MVVLSANEPLPLVGVKPMKLGWLAGLIFAMSLAIPAAHADIDQAVAAFERGDYEAALREVRPLAEAGDAEGQYLLGLLYAFGDVAQRDLEEATKWIRKAAEQDLPSAQASLAY